MLYVEEKLHTELALSGIEPKFSRWTTTKNTVDLYVHIFIQITFVNVDVLSGKAFIVRKDINA